MFVLQWQTECKAHNVLIVPFQSVTFDFTSDHSDEWGLARDPNYVRVVTKRANCTPSTLVCGISIAISAPFCGYIRSSASRLAFKLSLQSRALHCLHLSPECVFYEPSVRDCVFQRISFRTSCFCSNLSISPGTSALLKELFFSLFSIKSVSLHLFKDVIPPVCF